jgi:hypothetical protein
MRLKQERPVRELSHPIVKIRESPGKSLLSPAARSAR